jgi:hypothetical protein
MKKTASTKLSLNGDWQYSTEDQPDFAKLEFDSSGWQRMHLPQNWFLGGLDHHGAVWFRREFNYRSKDKHDRIEFEGVDYSAEVYLNGNPVGRHTGYFEPFRFDITKVLKKGKNLLAVHVDSPYEQPGVKGWHIRKRLIKGILNHHDCRPGGGWNLDGQSHNTGGIWNNVFVEGHGAVTIEQVLLRAEMENKPPLLHIQLTVMNRSEQQAGTFKLRVEPENFKGYPIKLEHPLETPPGESVHAIELPVPDVLLWQPWDRGFPHLYKVTVSLNCGKENVSHTSLFGFRTIKVKEGFRWFVNGLPYFVRGSNYIGSQWLAETIFPEAAKSKTHPFGGGAGGDFFRHDVEMARTANLNMLRVHAHVLPTAFHEACDRQGMLVWQDFPLQWGYTDEPDFHAEAEREMRAMVTGLYNHPSIAAWCVHNESPWDAPWMAGSAGATFDPKQNRELDTRLQATASELDPTRYVHCSSGNGDGHTYPGWYHGHWRDFVDLPGAPFVTEYGAQALPNKDSLLRMLPQFEPDGGYSELVRLKEWIEANRKVSQSTRTIVRLGYTMFRFMDRHPSLKRVKEFFMEWGIKRGQTTIRSIYQNLPDPKELPADLQKAQQVWKAWQFHDAQFMEAFENGVSTGGALDDFIKNSQEYQAHLIQFGTECYRRGKYSKVTGIIQFDFTDPWPAVTWSVLDYWRAPKAGYQALRRAMQPVLPSLRFPEKVEAGKAAPVSFFIINDLAESFSVAKCEWHLGNENGDIASASFPVDIPADAISPDVKLTLPSLRPGKYSLTITLTTGSKVLGENAYQIVVDDPEK